MKVDGFYSVDNFVYYGSIAVLIQNILLFETIYLFFFRYRV